MKLPKKIKVGNIPYDIIIGEENQKFLDEAESTGWHSPKDQVILIGEGLSPEVTRNTFFHELTHAILYEIGAMNEYDNELLVQSIANELDKLFELK